MLEELITNLREPRGNIDPHQVARVFTQLFVKRRVEGVAQIRDAYLYGQVASGKSTAEAQSLVNENLDFAARLADEVRDSGYEASGQLYVDLMAGGRISNWYRRLANQ